MHGLEVPYDFSRGGAKGDDRARVPVLALPHSAEVIGRGRGGGQEDEVALGIGGDHRPHVRPAGAGRASIAPGGVGSLARVLRDGVESPAEGARARVEAAHLSAGRGQAAVVGDGGARHHDVADHGRGRRHLVGLELERRHAQAAPQVHHPLLAEVRARPAALRIERHQARVDRRYEDAATADRARGGAAVPPITDAAAREVPVAALGIDARVMAPPLTSGGGVERDRAPEGRAEVHRAGDHERRGLERGWAAPARHDSGLAGMEGPGHLEASHIRPVDLGQRRVARSTRIASVGRPVRRRRGEGAGGEGKDESTQGEDAHGGASCPEAEPASTAVARI